jgi:hypothetical protein
MAVNWEGNVCYGLDFRKHLDKPPSPAETIVAYLDVWQRLMGLARDAGSIGDTAPSEYVAPDKDPA